MKKIICIFVLVFFVGTIYAWPCHPCGPGWHHPPPGPYYHGYYGNPGLYNAAAITSIVANSLDIISALSQPRVMVIQQQPAVQVVQPASYKVITQSNGQQIIVY